MASSNAPAGMHNAEGQNVDLYIPRKWCVAAPPARCALRLPGCAPRAAPTLL